MRHITISSLIAFLALAFIASNASAQNSDDDRKNVPRADRIFFEADADDGDGPAEIDIQATLIDNTLYVTGKVTNLSSPILENNTSKNGVHLYLGQGGDNDHDRVLPLEFAPTSNEKRGAIGGSIELNEDEIKQLRDREFFIDIHTEDYPDGEVRGTVTID